MKWQWRSILEEHHVTLTSGLGYLLSESQYKASGIPILLQKVMKNGKLKKHKNKGFWPWNMSLRWGGKWELIQVLVHVGGLLHSESKEEPLANPTLATLHLTLNPAWAQGFLHLVDSVLCGHMSTFLLLWYLLCLEWLPWCHHLAYFYCSLDSQPTYLLTKLERTCCSGTPLRYTLYLGFSVDLEVLWGARQSLEICTESI